MPERISAEEYKIALAPNWIEPIKTQENIEIPLLQISQGTYCLLSDIQTLVEDNTTN